MMMYGYKADREKELPYGHSEKCSTASVWSGLEEGGLRGSAASPSMVQQWYTRIKSLVQYQPYWGEIRRYSDGFMVAQHRRSHESWFPCHFQICAIFKFVVQNIALSLPGKLKEEEK